MGKFNGKTGKTIRFGFVLVLGLIFVVGLSCYRDYGLTTADYDMILTLYDNENDFTGYVTYALPDTVIHPVPDGEEDDLPRTFDSQMIADVVRNMNAMGFTRVDTTAANPPDVVVVITATKQEWTVGGYYPGYWWGWYPWYPGGGWYPYYPGYGYSYEFSTGTVFITMIDVDKYDPDAQLNATVWNATINGLAGDSRTSTSARIRSAINQAFAQSSSYLQR
jgi:hypothetical protein